MHKQKIAKPTGNVLLSLFFLRAEEIKFLLGKYSIWLLKFPNRFN